MMLMSLFSVFDPCTSYYFSFNWVSLILFILLLPVLYFILSGKIEVMIMNIVVKLKGDFYDMANVDGYGNVFFVFSVFFFVFVNNMMGLVPFIFTASSHPMITISLGLVYWMGFFLMGMIKKFKMAMIHMVPEGSPIMLSFFMVIIETVSHFVRPLTLSIRLAANMMAGHLIVGLLSSMSLVSISMGFFSVFLQMFLLILEIAVCVIQGFVFSVLLLLYMLEYY